MFTGFLIKIVALEGLTLSAKVLLGEFLAVVGGQT